jgi:5-methylcytosine-specific restriction protein A
MASTRKITALSEPLTEAKVLAAMRKFDRELRSTPDWANWDARKNHLYALLHEGKKYPVKEVVSVATGIPVGQLYGGEGHGHANTFFRGLPFRIISLHSNPDWVRDELILALNLYLKHRPNPPGKDSKEIHDLSVLLNRMGTRLFPDWERSETFRNENGVYMKLMNFRRLDPEYTSGGRKGLTRGNEGEDSVWIDFANDPQRCEQVAKAIVAALNESDAPAYADDEDDDGDDEGQEGRLLKRQHVSRERNRKLVAKKKRSVLKKLGRLECEVCGFNFGVRYGERGDGFIECHHTKPVASLGNGGKTHIDDLALVCANCHRVIHRGKPWLTIEEVRKLLLTDA